MQVQVHLFAKHMVHEDNNTKLYKVYMVQLYSGYLKVQNRIFEMNYKFLYFHCKCFPYNFLLIHVFS